MRRAEPGGAGGEGDLREGDPDQWKLREGESGGEGDLREGDPGQWRQTLRDKGGELGGEGET